MPDLEYAQITTKINPKTRDNFKIALIKRGDKKDTILETLIKQYIKDGLPV